MLCVQPLWKGGHSALALYPVALVGWPKNPTLVLVKVAGNANRGGIGAYWTDRTLLLVCYFRRVIASAPACHLQVTGLLQDGGRVRGVTYRTAEGQEERLPADAVVLATGGFGANKDLLYKYAPQVDCRISTRGPGLGDKLMNVGVCSPR